MARLNDAPSEASPLLGKDKKTPQLIDASAGIVPDNPAVTGEADPIVDGGALEQQTSAVERQRQYEGDLEMKKKIIWMFPALVLGVRGKHGGSWLFADNQPRSFSLPWTKR